MRPSSKAGPAMSRTNRTGSAGPDHSSARNQYYLHVIFTLPLVDGAMECCCTRCLQSVGFNHFSKLFLKKIFRTFSVYCSDTYQQDSKLSVIERQEAIKQNLQDFSST